MKTGRCKLRIDERYSSYPDGGSGIVRVYALYTCERYRADAIRALAIRSGMHYLGDALPRSLTLVRNTVLSLFESLERD